MTETKLSRSSVSDHLTIQIGPLAVDCVNCTVLSLIHVVSEHVIPNYTIHQIFQLGHRHGSLLWWRSMWRVCHSEYSVLPSRES